MDNSKDSSVVCVWVCGCVGVWVCVCVCVWVCVCVCVWVWVWVWVCAPIEKVPIPQEFTAMVATFDGLKEQLIAAASSPVGPIHLAL